MDITYLGHASFKIKGKDVVVITDPFDESIGIKFPKETADVVTVSHQHSDHNNTSAVSDVKKVLEGPGEYEIAGVSFIGIPTYHDDKKGEERGDNTIFVIEIEGVRIAHLGDLGHLLSEKQVDLLGTIDILMVPVGGFYTIDAKQAAGLVSSIEPKIILPMHYNSPDLNQDTFGKLSGVDEFLKLIEMKTTRDKKLKVTSALTTSEDQEVVVLNR